MLFATIFLVCFVLLGGVVMYLSQTIDHGEARFDSESGKPISEDEPKESGPAIAAKRIDGADEKSPGKDGSASEDA